MLPRDLQPQQIHDAHSLYDSHAQYASKQFMLSPPAYPARRALGEWVGTIAPESLSLANKASRCKLGEMSTNPAAFDAEFFVPVKQLPSDRVEIINISARVEPSQVVLEYPLGMPLGALTEVLVISTPARQLTLSVYAHADGLDLADGADTGALIGVAGTATADELASVGLAATKSTPSHLTASFPAPGPLLDALPYSTLPESTRLRAYETLDLLARTCRLSLADVLARDEAVNALTDNAESDRAGWSILGLDEPVAAPASETTSPSLYLRALRALSIDPLAAPYPSTSSSVSLALTLAHAQCASKHPCAPRALATVISLLGDVFSLPTPTPIPAASHDNLSLVQEYLARTLPPLAMHAAMSSDTTLTPTPTPLPVPLKYARFVLPSLLVASADVLQSRSCAAVAKALATPYVDSLPESDPLRAVWMPSTTETHSAPSVVPSSIAITIPPSPTSASTARLSQALMSPLRSDSIPSTTPYTTTLADLVTLLAPAFAASLATARQPPLGLAPSVLSPITPAPNTGPFSLPHMSVGGGMGGGGFGVGAGTGAAQGGTLALGGGGSASDYAGKVYSAHEFRRERESAPGLGLGLAGVGRKASKHVDEFKL